MFGHTHTEPFCDAEQPLVSGTTPIPDGSMTASTFWDPSTAPYQARLHNQPGIGNSGVWCSGSVFAYIQVRFVRLNDLIWTHYLLTGVFVLIWYLVRLLTTHNTIFKLIWATVKVLRVSNNQFLTESYCIYTSLNVDLNMNLN